LAFFSGHCLPAGSLPLAFNPITLLSKYNTNTLPISREEKNTFKIELPVI